MSNKDQREEENQLPQGGASTIALSLFIIVLAFFIFTVAISSPEKNKKTSLLASVEKTFGGLSMAERKTETPINQKHIAKAPVDFTPIISGDSELAKYAEIRVEYEYSALVVPADYFFEGTDTKIRGDSIESLDKIADLIRRGGYSAEITGYPSVFSPKEARASALRAMTIALHLSEKGNIPINRLSSFSWTGKRSPEDAKTDIEGKAPDYMEITFKAGSGLEEDESLKFKDFIFKVLD